MRVTNRWRLVALLSLAAALSACTKKSTAPDPNAAMDGTWSGEIRDTVQTPAGPQPRQFSLRLQFGPGGVGCTVDGAVHAAAVRYMHDPDVNFVVVNGSQVIGFSGTRAGDIMSGEGTWGDGSASGTWTVARFAVLGVTNQSP